MNEIDELFDYIEQRWDELQELPDTIRWKEFAALWDPFCQRLAELGYAPIATFQSLATPAQKVRMERYYARMRSLLEQ
jgi:hypothetical protein